MVRAETVGTHPRFIRMVRELIDERLDDGYPRLLLECLARDRRLPCGLLSHPQLARQASIPLNACW